MKVRALKNFQTKDRQREKMVAHTKGEIFDLPDKDDPDRQDLHGALTGRFVECIDETYIPDRARYVGVHGYSREKPDGTRQSIIPGEVCVLNQTEASELMGSGHIRPEREDQWRPKFLISGSMSKEPPKTMYDVEEAPANWATKEHLIKGGHE